MPGVNGKAEREEDEEDAALSCCFSALDDASTSPVVQGATSKFFMLMVT